jgi:hypothetical protein
MLPACVRPDAQTDELMSSLRDRVEERRQRLLASLHEQAANGSLVIRRITEEERRLYPPRAAEAHTRRPRSWSTP